MLTLGVTFGSVWAVVNRSQEKQLDAALLNEAHEEAREIAALGGKQLAISQRPGPAANDVGPLTKYAAIYDQSGTVLAATATFDGDTPRLARDQYHDETPFDLELRERLRAVVVRVPNHPELFLLLAAPRADLDGDAAFLARAMSMAFVAALVWSVVIAGWFVRRLTQEYESVAETVRRVAEGDVDARVGVQGQTTMLTRDMDEILSRLRGLLSAQQRFVANATHEIRTPLTALYGEVTFVLRRERSALEYRQALEEVLESTRRLNKLAEELLALARVGSASVTARTEIALDDLVQRVVAEYRVHAAERSMRFQLTTVPVQVVGRDSELERVMRNLIDNAIAHSPNGASIFVALSQEDRSAVITVRDEGRGIPEEDQERIFEPFFRGRSERASGDSGVGLGLAIAREIVRAHQGEIALVRDRDSRTGALFEVRIPLSEE